MKDYSPDGFSHSYFPLLGDMISVKGQLAFAGNSLERRLDVRDPCFPFPLFSVAHPLLTFSAPRWIRNGLRGK